MADKKTTEAQVDKTALSHKEEVKELNRALGVFGDKVTALTKDNENLLAANKTLRKKLEAKSPSGDCVVLDGRECKVVLRETAKELFVAVKRSEVDEDATVLVLDVNGG